MGLDFMADPSSGAPPGASEQRKYSRKSVKIDGELVVNGTRLACEIVDLSVGGARITLAGAFDADLPVALKIGKFGEFEAQIVRGQDQSYGLKFLADPELVAESLMALAVYGSG